ncbi:uncharacterized protein LOC144635801 [Oculina patagonica]
MNKSSENSQKVFVKSSTKGRGKDTEIRSKKHKNELHILKMSQEWDLRRQQRRLDRQKWVEERRNQKLPIWQRVGNLRVQANEEEILHGRPDNQHVNKKEHTKNSNEGSQARITKEEEIKVKVKQTVVVPPAESNSFRLKCARLSELIQDRYGSNQKRNSDEDEIQFIKTEQHRTINQPLQYSINTLDTSNVSAPQIAGQVTITTVKTSSKSSTGRDKNDGQQFESRTASDAERKAVRSPRKEARGSVPSQNVSTTEGVRVKDRKRKLDAVTLEDDTGQKPKLMCVDKPTTLESIERQNGPVTTSSSTKNSSTMMRHSRESLDQSVRGDETMPQIKQCYSLLDRREDDVLFVKRSQSKSTSVAVPMTTPVTMTTAPSQAKGLPSSVGVDPGCIVYISKPVAQTPSPGANVHPRAGYLLPVYKPDTREAAYAFLPAGAQLPHRTGDKAGLDTRAPDRKSNSYNTPVTSSSTHSHPLPHMTTGLKETHTASIPEKAKTIPHTQPYPSSLYRDNTSHNTRVHSSYDSSSVTVTLTNPSRADSAHVNGGSASGNGKTHAVNVSQAHSQQLKASAYIGTPQIPRQDLTNKSSAAPHDTLHYPAACRTPEIVPNPTANTQEAIFNPMSLYVRARLVPKEVVTVNHGAEPTSPPLVEYIKTDAICDKELTKWDAKNVADFIAATDCKDKAELFLEEEIDGKALLSLSPEMLMKGMNLKLGPAVKLYNHIANLRTALLL